VVGPGVPAADVKELVSFTKANPGRLSFASAGNGNPPHIAGELFRSETGIDIIHVPYKGVGQALTDVIGGQVSMLFTGLSSARPQIDAGKIRALVVTGARRAPTLPAVPTMAEAGFPSVDVTSWWSLFAPAGTPPEVVRAIASATQKAFSQPRLKDRLAVQAIEPEFADASALQAKLKSESERWWRVIRAATIVPE
jgi:tripartite-type tricarboxylate transporter receptor subunit TctC